MFASFVYALLQFNLLILYSIPALFDHGLRNFPKRLFIFIVFLPCFLLLQALHWLGFLLDELLFRAWRAMPVTKPIFIVGIPRSGTTFLQRTLANDPQFTTPSTWEVLFAPSVTEKCLYLGIAKLIKPIGQLLRTLTHTDSADKSSNGSSFFSKMKKVHVIGLQEPEEDFLFLLGLNACFLLISLYPSNRKIWKLSQFDDTLPNWEKRLILQFYKSCVRKHLYFKQVLLGRNEKRVRYLSKNPSFTPMITSLQQTFDEANFIACVRSPMEAVPSQLSSLRPAFNLLGSEQLPTNFVNQCVSMLLFYYKKITMSFVANSRSAAIVEMKQLKTNLSAEINRIYKHLELELSNEYSAFIEKASQNSGNYKSGHQYSLQEYGLTSNKINEQFSSFWPINSNL